MKQLVQAMRVGQIQLQLRLQMLNLLRFEYLNLIEIIQLIQQP